MAKRPKGTAEAKPAATGKPASRSSKRVNIPAKANYVDSGQRYVVFGTVTFAAATPAAGLTVIAYDKDVSGKDSLGQAITDKAGTYKIPYSDADVRRTEKERGGADVIVRVYNDKHELLFTSQKKNNASPEYELNITVPAKPFVVHGKVTGANQKPLANMIVRAFKRDLRALQLLGADKTGANGEYRIEYHLADFHLGDAPSRRAPWLIVEVHETPDGEVMAKQEVQKAASDQTISFALAHVGAVPEWQRISETVSPLLKGRVPSRLKAGSPARTAMAQADLAPYEITAADVDFIAQGEELDRAAVDAWVASSRMVQDAVSRLTEEHAQQQATLREDGGPFFYAIARQGLAQDLDAVLRESAAKWQQAYRAARAANRMPALDDKRVKSVADALELLRRLQQLDPVRSGNSDFARVLTNSPLPLSKTVALDALTIYQEKGLANVDALLKLAEKHPDAEAPIKTFVRGVRVHQLVSGHEGLSRLLNARLEGTSDSIAPLATLPSAEWMRLADEASMSQGRALLLQAKVEHQYPLAALQARVSAGHLQLPGVSSREISALIKKQAAIVETILRGAKPAKDAAVKEESAAHKVLRDVGRFVRTGVNMETAGHLINKGVATPAVAIRYGRETIREMLREIHSRDAASGLVDGLFDTVEPVLAGANGFLIDMALNRRAPAFMQEKDTQRLSNAALATFGSENLPSLPGLFGDLDECICKPCESMLGQPAYLVDLLNLLGMNPGAFAKLVSKRPDIPELKLNCGNAETIIQHIDIVLEILEQAAAPDADHEHSEQIAYEKLAAAIFPWNLPFDRKYAETKAYLAKLGVARSSLQLLRSDTTAEQLAAETLGLSFEQTGNQGTMSEWQLLIDGRTGDELWAAYGFSPNSDGYVELVDPASNDPLNLPVKDVLRRASVLMDRTGLELEELEQVLATDFMWNLELSNRDQCKTSQMRVPEIVSTVETLDRLHRFTRLLTKLPDWSIAQIDNAIGACGGIENEEPDPRDRRLVLADLATVKRLHENQGLPLDWLLDMSETNLRNALGLSAQEFSLLKTIAPIDLINYPFDWVSLEKFINAKKRIRESGLTIEQVAEALLTREHLIELFRELPPSIKTDKQIEELLVSVQKRLRAVVAIRSDVTLESQATEALTAIFDAATADKLVKAIRDAGAKDASVGTPDSALVAILSAGPTHILGEWLPLLSRAQTDEILTVVATNNPDVNARFKLLLEGIAFRRRERELITVISEQCGLSEADSGSLLTSRLSLDVDGTKPTNADAEFLNVSFWGGETLPPVTVGVIPRLHAWMDRLYRLVALSAVLKLDSELMHIADSVVVPSRNGPSDAPRIGINWSEMLASTPPATSAWDNPNWLALLDMLWLQKPEQLSRTVLSELLVRLAAIGTAAVSEDAVRPLATRVEISEVQTLAIAGQVVTVSNARNLRDPTQLRRAFELLLLARHLGADGAQLAQLANTADNAQAATTAKQLLQAKVGQQAWPAVRQRIDDQLRQQQRDALVAYLIHNNKDGLRNANDLYEHYLIDPQMEPCFETTRILEAITATQLFAQRILFGLEPGISTGAEPDELKELKQRWTWMRNYRVWEANRKVFLFPENWMFPELRDDKSSSFKQLESALGQGELTQDLARQSFGQFLDDVAQMGQVEVLGMYEDLSRNDNGDIVGSIQPDGKTLPDRRTLYVVGRTPNPPYAYFRRHCVDFGSTDMEWAPWQRIELDIQGDHVMPFVLGGDLHIAWPLIRRIKNESADDSWEVKLAWSRYDGNSWRKSSVSREYWSDKAAAFSDERRGFAFRCETALGKAALDGSAATITATIRVFAFAKSDTEDQVFEDSKKASSDVWDADAETYPGTATNVDSAYDFLKNLILNSYGESPIPPVRFKADVYPTLSEDDKKLPSDIKHQLFLYCYIKNNWDRNDDLGRHGAADGLNKRLHTGGRTVLFADPALAEERYTTFVGFKYPDTAGTDATRIPNDAYIKSYVKGFISEFWNDANRKVDTDIFGNGGIQNTQYFDAFHNTLKHLSSRRIVHCHARIKLTAPDSTNTISSYPLDGTEGIYECIIDSEVVSLTPGGFTELAWKLGDQPGVNCKLSLTLGAAGTKQVTLRSSQDLVEIKAGYETTQHLYLEFDGTKYNASDIGFDLDASKNLMPVSEFHLTRDDMVSRLLPENQNELYNPVDGSRPWMNGFREITPAPVRPLRIVNSQSDIDITVFDLTPPAQFWIVGSASSKGPHAPGALPLAWHYSEGGISRYIDLGDTVKLENNSGLFVYPDSYKEATLRRSDWSQSQTLESPAFQSCTFSADALPEIKSGAKLYSQDWVNAGEGRLTFDARLPYACYNWEVCFHAPLLIADQLSKQHKFEDAERWLRFVFDPTSSDSGTDAKRFLKFRVFKELDLSKQVIDDLTALAQVAGGYGNPDDDKTVKKLIDRWRDAPFRPFLIARRRPIAFLWQTLFAYLDNLIAWADSLYRRDTIESINEATMLYVLAERILGRRPQLHEGSSSREGWNYEDLTPRWDEFANFWIDVGTINPDNPPLPPQTKPTGPSGNGTLYFCMPFNDKIFSYWNIIESRLSNVRNCRNIEGIERKLPLMDAPIDPELLVRATAAGLDLGDVISGLYAPPPHYRYSILSARATELANEAKALGAAMLSAIEKRDAEHLAQLRSSNEISLLKLVSEVRTLQITEAERNIEALRGSRRSVESRYSQYQRLLGKKDIKVPDEHETAGEDSMLGSVDSALASNGSNLGLIKEENEQYIGIEGANTWATASGIAKIVGGGLHTSASIVLATPAGATNAPKVLEALGTSASYIGDAFSMVSQGWKTYAEQQGMLAGHLRRRDEWAFQSNQTLKEMKQIDKQILANQIRIDITKKELNNHTEQIEQAKAVDEVMRSKFSNEQLYQWMISQLSGLYFNAYRMALEMARRAERAAARELGVKPLNILHNDYWDSLRAGLLAGERLHQDIKRLEVAYLDQNRREYELTKHISLRRLDPEALVNLRMKDSDGHCSCEFDLPEWLFDLDTPGHYLRRIKSVSVSIPSVAGPFTSVNCKLTLLKSEVRHERSLIEGSRYLRLTTDQGQPTDDDRFTDYYGASEAIVTSTGNGDSGLFETQLRDERFLPFEGSGVISTWRLELPGEYPQFDYSTISDVVISIRYTTRDGGDSLRDAATGSIATLLTTPQAPGPDPLRFHVVLSGRADFPTEWAHARTTPGVKIPITRNVLPYWMDAANLAVREVHVADLTEKSTNPLTFKLVWPPPTGVTDPDLWLEDVLNRDGVGEGNLGQVSDTMTDKILLLAVGVKVPAVPPT